MLKWYLAGEPIGMVDYTHFAIYVHFYTAGRIPNLICATAHVCWFNLIGGYLVTTS